MAHELFGPKRHEMLSRGAQALRRQGADRDRVRRALGLQNEVRCRPPLAVKVLDEITAVTFARPLTTRGQGQLGLFGRSSR